MQEENKCKVTSGTWCEYPVHTAKFWNVPNNKKKKKHVVTGKAHTAQMQEINKRLRWMENRIKHLHLRYKAVKCDTLTRRSVQFILSHKLCKNRVGFKVHDKNDLKTFFHIRNSGWDWTELIDNFRRMFCWHTTHQLNSTTIDYRSHFFHKIISY